MHFTPSRVFAVLAATCLTRITANAVNISLSHVYAEASNPLCFGYTTALPHCPFYILSHMLPSHILPKANNLHLPLQQHLCTRMQATSIAQFEAALVPADQGHAHAGQHCHLSLSFSTCTPSLMPSNSTLLFLSPQDIIGRVVRWLLHSPASSNFVNPTKLPITWPAAAPLAPVPLLRCKAAQNLLKQYVLLLLQLGAICVVGFLDGKHGVNLSLLVRILSSLLLAWPIIVALAAGVVAA